MMWRHSYKEAISPNKTFLELTRSVWECHNPRTCSRARPGRPGSRGGRRSAWRCRCSARPRSSTRWCWGWCWRACCCRGTVPPHTAAPEPLLTNTITSSDCKQWGQLVTQCLLLGNVNELRVFQRCPHIPLFGIFKGDPCGKIKCLSHNTSHRSRQLWRFWLLYCHANTDFNSISFEHFQ